VTKVAIIDSGGANIASLLIAFERLQTEAILTSDADLINDAERVVLPGVGAAKDAMDRLTDAGLVDVIKGLRQPVLGICLGMQLLFDGSEEENVECLGVFPGTARKLNPGPQYPVPNMGWCATGFTAEHQALANIDDGSYFYYLHSYALPVSENTLATAKHANEFSAIVAHENFVAAQFHPERSSAAGAQLLRNFLGLPL
jgi:glutamine amidotransferase